LSTSTSIASEEVGAVLRLMSADAAAEVGTAALRSLRGR
jgi:hypothetical protein